MGATNAGDVIRVDVIGDFNQGSAVVNVFEFQAQGGLPLAEDVLDDIEDVLVLIYTIAKALTNVLTVIRKFKVSNLSQGTIIGEVGLISPISGTAAGDPAAPGTAALTYYRTEVPRVQLRKYWGVLAKGMIDNQGTLTSGARTILGNLNARMITPFVMTGDTYVYGTLSPKTGTFLAPPAASFAEQCAYQRRRKPGVGL